MILVDTSIWVDHLRTGDPVLGRLLDDGQVLGHPWVAGELALGGLIRRMEILTLMANQPQAVLATATRCCSASSASSSTGEASATWTPRS